MHGTIKGTIGGQKGTTQIGTATGRGALGTTLVGVSCLAYLASPGILVFFQLFSIESS